jgi:soluble lytic murein transglycosylase
VSRWPVRWLLLGVILVLGIVTLLFLRGPSFWQRQYYPLGYQTEIAESAARHRISPYLVAAVINAESSWGAEQVSGVGAIGLMQVMPQTARDLAGSKRVDRRKFPPDKLLDPATNIEYGTAYLRYLVDRYHEVEMALAAYNAGLSRVDQWAKKGNNIRSTIEFPETKKYVLKVIRGKERYEALHPDAFVKQ